MSPKSSTRINPKLSSYEKISGTLTLFFYKNLPFDTNKETLSSMPAGTTNKIKEFCLDLTLKNSLWLDSILNCEVEVIFPNPLSLKDFESQSF